MKTIFEFTWDSGATGIEEDYTYDKFVEHALPEAIDHYNTVDCYIDENGKVHPEMYKDEDGGIVTMEDFKPDLHLFDKDLKRMIHLNIEGYDENKVFKMTIVYTECSTLTEFHEGEMYVFEYDTVDKYTFETPDVNLVKYCYKLVFEQVNDSELINLVQSIDGISLETYYEIKE